MIALAVVVVALAATGTAWVIHVRRCWEHDLDPWAWLIEDDPYDEPTCPNIPQHPKEPS